MDASEIVSVLVEDVGDDVDVDADDVVPPVVPELLVAVDPLLVVSLDPVEGAVLEPVPDELLPEEVVVESPVPLVGLGLFGMTGVVGLLEPVEGLVTVVLPPDAGGVTGVEGGVKNWAWGIKEADFRMSSRPIVRPVTLS